MSANPIDILRNGEGGEVLDALYALCANRAAPRIDDDALVRRLVRSPDPLVRERAIFLFGIRSKKVELCGEFLGQLADERLDDAPIVSALMLAFLSSGCAIDLAPLRRSLARFLDDPQMVREIGVLLVGFTRVAAGGLGASEIRPYLTRNDEATAAELEEARGLLA